MYRAEVVPTTGGGCYMSGAATDIDSASCDVPPTTHCYANAPTFVCSVHREPLHHVLQYIVIYASSN